LLQLQETSRYKDTKGLIDKTYYLFGTKLMNDKDYLIGIEKFQKLTKENIELYPKAQKRIAECKKLFITSNVALANVAIGSRIMIMLISM